MRTIKKQKIFIFLIIASLLILYGCAECKKDADCPSAGKCFTPSCIDKKCSKTAIANCCGNLQCEEGETKCSCQQDCGLCSGKDKNWKYLKYVCDNVTNECVSDVDETLVKQETITDSINIGVAKLSANYKYDFPYNIDKSLFNLDIGMDSKQADITKVKISKIKVYERITEKKLARLQETILLGEKIVDKTLWDTSSVISETIALGNIKLNSSEQEKGIQVEIFYEYYKLSQGKETNIQSSYKKDLSSKMIFVDPEKTRKCPVSCDDNNECTLDKCSELTSYFCQHIIKEEICCGNNICDETENQCTCAIDCGICERSYGNYMEFKCYLGSCKSKLKDASVIQPKTLVQTANLADFQMETKLTFDTPFNLKKSTFELDFNLQTLASGILNIKINKIQVLASQELLGEKILSLTFSSIGNTGTAKVPLDFSMGAEQEKTVTAKVFYEYDKTSGETTTHQIKTSEHSVGKLIFVNPDIT